MNYKFLVPLHYLAGILRVNFLKDSFVIYKGKQIIERIIDMNNLSCMHHL